MQSLKDFKFKMTITNILIVFLIAIFLLQIIFGINATIFSFGLNGRYVFGLHEYWRLFTSAFLHASLFHLLMNCYFIYIIGTKVEEILGTPRYLALLVCTIFFSSFAVALMDINRMSMQFTIGISGFGYGLVGLITSFALLYPNRYYKPLALSLISNLVFYTLIFVFLSDANISWIGHLGGFIGGLVTGGILNTFFHLDEW
ncbi:hypothetical protein AwErysi_01910 [Erysipelotrichaceae bacterium]|nr:hypothetical protein AwErysi_01910 [Erysipelotrichaceae bacterium]